MDSEPRDAAYWAKNVTTLKLGKVPARAVNLNVTGRRVVGPVQGFGRMWQKTARVALRGAEVTPAEVIRTWKAEVQRFWPERTWLNWRVSEPEILYEWPVFVLLSTNALVTAALMRLLVHRNRLSAPVNADCAAGKLALV